MLRFAPSPTGEMLLSDLWVAVVNYLVAQQRNDKFLVRIDDGDTPKNIEGKDTEIMMILEKFALKHDGVHHQSEHLGIHQTLAIRLLQEKRAFICLCDESLPSCAHSCATRLDMQSYAELKEKKEPFSIRIKPSSKEILFEDELFGMVRFSPVQEESDLILKQDGTPSQLFGTACEDMLGSIDFIIRQNRYLEQTPKEIHIKNSLGYQSNTHHAHLPEMVEDLTVRSLLEQGFVPDAILNYLIALGNEKYAQSLFTLPEAVVWFELKAIGTEPIKMDWDRLRWLNREHLKQMDDRTLSTLFGFADADIGKLAKCYLDKVTTTRELEERIKPIFRSKSFEGEQGEMMRKLSRLIFNAPYFEEFDTLVAYLVDKSGLDRDQIDLPLRLLLFGVIREDDPTPEEIYPFIKLYLLEVAS